MAPCEALLWIPFHDRMWAHALARDGEDEVKLGLGLVCPCVGADTLDVTFLPRVKPTCAKSVFPKKICLLGVGGDP